MTHWLKYKVLFCLDFLVVSYVKRRFLGECWVGLDWVKYHGTSEGWSKELECRQAEWVRK